MRCPSLVLLFSLVALLLVEQSAVSAQDYSPQVARLTTATCPSGSSLISVGDDSAAPVTAGFFPGSAYSFPWQYYMRGFNGSRFGGRLQQLSLGLGDNSAQTLPVHLRLAVFLVLGDGNAQLLAQTDELVVYPSGAQVLYAALPAPLWLTSGGQYALAASFDQPLALSFGAVATSYSAYGGYSAAGFYPTLSVYADMFDLAVSMAAYGCLDPSTQPASGATLYSFCAYSETSRPSTSKSDWSKPATTLTSFYSGLLAVASAATSTTFGSGYAVTLVEGELVTDLEGTNYYVPTAADAATSLVLSTSNLIKAVTPSNLVYPSGAAAFLDSGGLSLTTGTGIQLVIQYSTSTSSYVFLNSSVNGGAPGNPAFLSNFSLTRLIGTAVPPDCPKVLPQVYVPEAVTATCPAGSAAFSYGSLLAPEASENTGEYDFVDANNVYTHFFVAGAPGTSVISLSVAIHQNPNTIIHARMGLFAVNGTQSQPTALTLLAQTKELTVANSGDLTLTGNLPFPLPLTFGALYSIGIWYDTALYSPVVYEWDYGQNYLYDTELNYQSVGSGNFPSSLTPARNYYSVALQATACLPSAGPKLKFAFCAAWANPWSSDVYAGVLTVLGTQYTDSFGTYRVVVAGSGLIYNEDDSTTPFVVSSGADTDVLPRLYDPATTQGGVVLDGTGFVLTYQVGYGYYTYTNNLAISTSPIPNTPLRQYVESYWYQDGSVYPDALGGFFSLHSYVDGANVPPCVPPVSSALNLVTPPSVGVETCTGLLLVPHGDSNIFDYANNREGNRIPALTLYTNTFVALAGERISVLTVDVLSNVNVSVRIQMGVYSPTNALVGKTSVVVLNQTFDQQISVPLLAPFTTVAGTYTLTLMADAPFSIATATSTSPIASVTSFAAGLPATFASTGMGGAVPLLTAGCLSPTHTMCMVGQYHSAASGVTTANTYQAFINAAANSDGSLNVIAVAGHVTVATSALSTSSSSTSAFASLTKARSVPATLRPSASAVLDSAGIALATSLGTNVTLSYDAGKAQYVDTWGLSQGFLVASFFNLSALGTFGLLVPSCGPARLGSTVSAQPAQAPACGANQTAVTWGDDVASDFDVSGLNFFSDYFGQSGASQLTTSAFNTGANSTAVSQLAVALSAGTNVYARLQMALYDSNLTLVSSTGEITVVNPTAQVVVGALNATVTLRPLSQYYIALWSDQALTTAFSFNSATQGPCAMVPYGGGWPSVLVMNEEYCPTVPLAALGCSLPPIPSAIDAASCPGSSSSNSSSGGRLSDGAVAGVVVGCVLGVNLLLLICVFLVMRARSGEKRATTKPGGREPSNTSAANLEMAGAE